MVSKGHRKASNMGKAFEKDVVGMLNDVGFIEVTKQDVDNTHPMKWYCRQYKKFVGIYGKLLTIDLLIFDQEHFPNKLSVELKYQSVGGSVDEKFPFVIQNMRKLFRDHGLKGLLLLNGGGYNTNAVKWSKGQQDENLFVVEGRSDIYNWIEDNLS